MSVTSCWCRRARDSSALARDWKPRRLSAPVSWSISASLCTCES
jgi:hypothetical protein